MVMDLFSAVILLCGILFYILVVAFYFILNHMDCALSLQYIEQCFAVQFCNIGI